jgi:hypothetical protein
MKSRAHILTPNKHDVIQLVWAIQTFFLSFLKSLLPDVSLLFIFSTRAVIRFLKIAHCLQKISSMGNNVGG